MLSTEQLYHIFKQFPQVTTDTRKINKDDIFFALQGPSFNGNAFAKTAIEKDASYAIVDDEKYAELPNILCVPHVLTALQQLALHHRQQFNIPVLAITGSNGKTTTKELIHAVLSKKYKTYTTQGNLNNHIGVPLTLLSIASDAEMAVIEMGANHQREIAAYCSYTEPTHGLITNCGKAHLEGFGGVEGVRKGKGELFDFLRATNGVAFACADFDYFQNMTRGLQKLHWYGTQNGEVCGSVLQSEPFLSVHISKGLPQPTTLGTQLVGGYNAYNVLAAVMVGTFFGIEDKAIAAAIAEYTPTNSRSQLMVMEGNHIIMDAYNANPTSMAAAIENFARLKAPNKMLFLGGMMELGDESLNEHQQIVHLIEQFEWKDVILVGGDFSRVRHGFRYFTSSDEAAAWWQAQKSTGNYLLVKGSRSMKMERIVAPTGG
jgi:UDP-N-acetylmuramoyl-tripeptide--D-alanyl-D-alanine ligase